MDTKGNKYRSFIVLLYQYLWHVYATHNILLWINLVCKYTTTVSYTLSNDLVLVEQEVIILPKHQSSLPLGFVEFYILFSTQCLLDDCLSLCSSSFGYCFPSISGFWLPLENLQTFLWKNASSSKQFEDYRY